MSLKPKKLPQVEIRCKVKKHTFAPNHIKMQLTEVQSVKEVLSFQKLPFEIYREFNNWVPHLKQDVEKVFDPTKNKLFRQGDAIRWIAEKDGKCVGRIAAFVSDKYSQGMEQPTGGLGFFECINDASIANSLLDKATGWLKERGVAAVDGPINFGEKNMFWGLQIENFEDPPSYGMNFNPEYYVKFFEDYGFRLYYNQFCYKRDMFVPVQEVFLNKAEAIEQDPDYRFSNVRGMSMEKIGEDFLTVYNNAWGGHHGFKTMKRAEAMKIMKALKPVIDRDIIVFGYHKEKPMAFYVNIPELNEIFCFVNGNLNWLGKLKFMYHKWRKTPKTMTGIVFGIDRSYHGKGIEGALVKWTEQNIVTLNRYSETVLTWIGDFNPKMVHIAENLGASRYRTLATYRLLFDRTAKFARMPMAT